MRVKPPCVEFFRSSPPISTVSIGEIGVKWAWMSETAVDDRKGISPESLSGLNSIVNVSTQFNQFSDIGWSSCGHDLRTVS